MSTKTTKLKPFDSPILLGSDSPFDTVLDTRRTERRGHTCPYNWLHSHCLFLGFSQRREGGWDGRRKGHKVNDFRVLPRGGEEKSNVGWRKASDGPPSTDRPRARRPTVPGSYTCTYIHRSLPSLPSMPCLPASYIASCFS